MRGAVRPRAPVMARVCSDIAASIFSWTMSLASVSAASPPAAIFIERRPITVEASIPRAKASQLRLNQGWVRRDIS